MHLYFGIFSFRFKIPILGYIKKKLQNFFEKFSENLNERLLVFKNEMLDCEPERKSFAKH